MRSVPTGIPGTHSAGLLAMLPPAIPAVCCACRWLNLSSIRCADGFWCARWYNWYRDWHTGGKDRYMSRRVRRRLTQHAFRRFVKGPSSAPGVDLGSGVPGKQC